MYFFSAQAATATARTTVAARTVWEIASLTVAFWYQRQHMNGFVYNLAEARTNYRNLIEHGKVVDVYPTSLARRSVFLVEHMMPTTAQHQHRYRTGGDEHESKGRASGSGSTDL
jgi:hypothetical protein